MAFCENCGRELSDRAPSCPNCGHPSGTTSHATGHRRTEGSATASLVLGIAGLVVCPLVCSVLAIIFGNKAKGKIAADPNLEGEGLAKAGVILGWIGVGLGVVTALLFIAAISSGGGTGY